jgi:hypothetical protein
MKKLSPKLTFGCSKCQKKKEIDELDLTITGDFKLSEIKDSSKVVSLRPKERKSSSKVISLF